MRMSGSCSRPLGKLPFFFLDNVKLKELFKNKFFLRFPGCLSRIPDDYPASEFFPFGIPNPNFFHPRSRIRIFPSRIRITEFTYFNPKIVSSLKHHPVCSSRIRIMIFYPSLIPDPGVKKAPDPGSATLNS